MAWRLHDLVVPNDEVVAYFQAESSKIASLFSEERLPLFADFYSTFIGSLTAFLSAERTFKRAERYALLEKDPEAVKELSNSAEKEHERGLSELGGLLSPVNYLGQELSNLDRLDSTKASSLFAELFNDILLKMADSDVKPADIQKLRKAGDAMAAEIAETGVAKSLDNTLSRFEAVRRSEDRGTKDNIPPWKIFGLLVLGLAVLALFVSSLTGGRANLANLSPVVAGAFLLLMALGC